MCLGKTRFGYGSTLGEGISRDPIGERGGIDLYGYVGNSPVCFVDPSGLISTRANPVNEGPPTVGGALQAFGEGALFGAAAIGAFEAGAYLIPAAILAAETPEGEEELEELEDGGQQCPHGGGTCFPKGTLVATPTGEHPIEDLRVGDTVFSYDFKVGKVVVEKIAKLNRNFTYHWVDVKIGTETIHATRGHRFWIESQKRWIEAERLQRGMTVRGENGIIKPILAVTIRNLVKPDATYNFIVQTEHDYFVGNPGILVHNGYPDLTQQSQISQLRAGQDVNVSSVEDARALLDYMPELQPAPGSGGPGTYPPPGTYRGDLINTGPTLEDYNSPPAHGDFEGPHYNIINPDGTKPAIRINPEGC